MRWNGKSLLSGPWRIIYATNVWGGKDKRAYHTQKAHFSKIGKVGPELWMRADIGSKKDVQPIPPQKSQGLG